MAVAAAEHNTSARLQQAHTQILAQFTRELSPSLVARTEHLCENDAVVLLEAIGCPQSRQPALATTCALALDGTSRIPSTSQHTRGFGRDSWEPTSGGGGGGGRWWGWVSRRGGWGGRGGWVGGVHGGVGGRWGGGGWCVTGAGGWEGGCSSGGIGGWEGRGMG